MEPDKILSALLDDVGRARDTCFQRGISQKRITGMVSFGAYRILAQCATAATAHPTFTLCEHVTIMDVVMAVTPHYGVGWCVKIPEGA